MLVPKTLSIVAMVVCCVVCGLARQDGRGLVERAREYVAAYERELVALVADEHYLQSAVGSGRNGEVTRVLDSECAWVAIPAPRETISVREVLRVGGRTVNEHPRLRNLLEHPPPDPLRDFSALLAESATHNIGDVQRNINFPTFALAYLRARPDDEGMRWWFDSTPDGVMLRFEERGRATVVHLPNGRSVPARGAFVIDAGSGRILRSSLTVPIRTGGRKLQYHLDVDFAEDERLAVWVPVRMRERATSSDGVMVIAGEATYTNYRRYVTGARIVR